MTILSLPVFMMSSVSFFLGLFYFQMFLRRKRDVINFYFSMTCFSVGMYDFLCAMLYRANSYSEGFKAQSYQFPILALFAIAITWFLVECVDLPKIIAWFITFYMGIFFVLGFIFKGTPFTIDPAQPNGLIITIGNFLDTTIYECKTGVLFDYQSLGLLFLIAIAFYLLIRAFLKGNKSVRPLIFALSMFLIFSINDLLVVQRVYSFIYMTEYAFLAIIIAMASILMNQFLALHAEVEELNRDLEIKVEQRTSELMVANEKLAELDTLKNDFIANITHDFRSPLTIILNTADIAIKYEKDIDACLQKFGIVFNSSLKLKASIDRLLDLSKMDVAGVKLNIRKTNLKAFVANISEFYHSSLLVTNIKFFKEMPAQAIDDFYTDLDKLEEIINNLISNAVKFIDREQGEISIILEDCGQTIKILIKDNGIGIPEDKLEIIFERFRQTEGGMNSIYHGTGIGLAFCKQLVSYLHGTIIAKNNETGGACFIVELPKGKAHFHPGDIISESAEEIVDQSKETKKLTSKLLLDDLLVTSTNEIITMFTDLNKDDEYDLHKGIILLVDDNQDILKIELTYLQNAGYKNFILANNGKLGSDAAYKYRPDIILCDYNMPVMRGDQLHDELVNNPDFKKLPFVFISALADKNAILERKKKGALAYLQKPIDETDFLLTVELHLQKWLELKETLKRATHDQLTGLHNKAQLMGMLKSYCAANKYRDLSLIFFDLDHFKLLNDTYGHQAGDQMLIAVGHAISEAKRNSDIAARYGGEEFVLILSDTSLTNSVIAAEKMRKIIASMKVTYNNNELRITASMGVASLRDNAAFIEKKLGINSLKEFYEITNDQKPDWDYVRQKKSEIPDILLEMSDVALYRAKATRCSNCNFSSEKSELFKGGICPECKSPNLLSGRNKTVAFEEIDIVSSKG